MLLDLQSQVLRVGAECLPLRANASLTEWRRAIRTLVEDEAKAIEVAARSKLADEAPPLISGLDMTRHRSIETR